MPRGLAIFLSICALVAVFGIWGLPWITHSLFGDKAQVKVIITSAVDDYEVEIMGSKKTVPRTVVGMCIDFPMGGEPENTNELQVKDAEGRVLNVFWSAPDKEDLPDKGVTRWSFKAKGDGNPGNEVYFPIQFRQGALWNKNRELAYIKLPPVPFPAP